MEYVNLAMPSEKCSFPEAAIRGLGSLQGLFFPAFIPVLEKEKVLELPRMERCLQVLKPFVEPELSQGLLAEILEEAFSFEASVKKLEPSANSGNAAIFALELFNGPSLAFKDFGARFMASCLSRIKGPGPMTILTATSGDTGAAVAHAFFGMEGIKVVVLYPEGKISRAQEQLFCSLGGNIHTIAVAGSFDDCQAMAKAAFDNTGLVKKAGLNSANSINMARLVAQITYYWDLCASLGHTGKEELVVSVPSGNFGNLTAGLMAKAMGCPIKGFVAATNINDTVPRYLHSGKWQPLPTRATSSNAMDVSKPNNWPRAEKILKDQGWTLDAISVNEEESFDAIRELDGLGYEAEPHSAVAYAALKQALKPGQRGAFLCTAHPTKFAEAIQAALGRAPVLPEVIKSVMDKKNLSVKMAVDNGALYSFLMDLV